MHTNSAIAALPRLLDLKIEPSLIASSLIGVMSQRLIRRICTDCRQEDTPPASLVADFFGRARPQLTFYRGGGCAACGGTGYLGRMVVADFWVPDDEDLRLITRLTPFDEVRRSAQRTTFSMAEDAFNRLKQGLTTLEELSRMLPALAVAEFRARHEAAAVGRSA
jgi:type IV pilus assembly protein PilB